MHTCSRLRLITRYFRPWPLTLLTLLFAGVIALQLLAPLYLGQFIDAVILGQLDTALGVGSIFLGITIAQYALALVRDLAGQRISWHATNMLRVDLLQHLLRLDLAYFKTHTQGELIERVEGDCSMLADFFSDMVVSLFGNAVLATGIIVLLARLDWRLGLVGLGFAIAVLTILRLIQRRSTEVWRQSRTVETTYWSFFGERLQSPADIVTSGASSYTLDQHDALAQKNLRAYLTGNLQRGKSTTARSIVSGAAYLGVLGLGAWLYISNQLSIGSVTVALRYAAMLANPMGMIQRHIDLLREYTASLERVIDLLSTQSRLADTGTDGWPEIPASIHIQEVSFRYDDYGEGQDAEVLENIELVLNPGQITGLIGRTGSGKSTLARLLLRLYDPSHGIISIGQTSFTEIPLQQLRTKITFVTQNIELFRGTLRENLTLFHNVPDDELWAALGQLGLDEWIAQQLAGLDTHIAGQQSLSAGEGQLVAMTRALLSDPDYIILDEPSAHLDPVTAHLIDQALTRFLAGRGAVIIAHRMETLANCDQVVMLEKGQIIEHGAPNELLTHHDSQYHQLTQDGTLEKEVLA